eukprot:SAG11_NODE_4415_length_1905_cov_2.187708_1_plen_357_part_10
MLHCAYRRIYLDQEVDLTASTIEAILNRLLWLVSTFASSHPLSPLPAACQTALELAKSLSSDHEKVRQFSPSDMLVQSLSTALQHEDGTDITRLGALECFQGLLDAYTGSVSTGDKVVHLLSACRGSLSRIVLQIIADPPPNGQQSQIYGETCATLCFLVTLSPQVFRLLCSYNPAAREEESVSAVGRISPPPPVSKPPPPPPPPPLPQPVDWRAALPALGDLSLTKLPGVLRLTADLESTAELSLKPEEPEPEPLAFSRGGPLGTILRATHSGAYGDEMCALIECVVTVLFEGHAVAQARLESCVRSSSGGGGSEVGSPPVAKFRQADEELPLLLGTVAKSWARRIERARSRTPRG